MIQTLELFGGIGAPRAALRNIGIPVKAIDYVEIDEKAVRSYNAMFDHEHHAQNVVGWNLRPDLLVHGSPCQDFSIAGHQKGGDEGSNTRSSLMWETLKIIRSFGEWRPKVVIWENVKNVCSKAMVHNFERYLQEMGRLGYKSSFACLNAFNFGLPQMRERVFTVSVLSKNKFDFKRLRFKDAPTLEHFLSSDYKPWHLVTQKSVLSCIGSKGIRRATVLHDVAMTITTRQDRTPAQVIALPNGQYRYLTELECWRLMGFDDSDFYSAQMALPECKGMNRTLYKQAGNSMPVPVLESLFSEIFRGDYL